jgi:hypothetical protein
MARIYSIPFQALTVSAKQDLWAITTGSSLEAVIEEIVLDPCGTSVSELAISLNLYTASYTAGSGGSTATLAKHDPGDAGASFTAKLQNMTQTSGGTHIVLRAFDWQIVNGLLWQPQQPGHAYRIPISACMVVSLDTTPGSSLTVSGNAIVREGSY